MARKPLHVYSLDPAWSDVIPIPQDDGGPNALATIAYTNEYRETSSYLRAVMAAQEHSPRVLDLTAHLIELNPAHYTVWLYRAKVLSTLHIDPRDELPWLNAISLKHIKNYQIWHHRQLLLERLASLLAPTQQPSQAETKTHNSEEIRDVARTSETAFLTQMLQKDAKNYHVWSYRQWLVRRFGLWEGAGEMERTEGLLSKDVRNNSAWNHRWFLVFGREMEDKDFRIGEAAMRRELDFVKAAIRLAPQNESPWNYLRGLLRKKGTRLGEDEEAIAFAGEFADVEKPGEVRSTHALNLLAEAWEDETKSKGGLLEVGRTMQKSKMKAGVALDLLADKYDPIRANYWNYRKSLLGLGKETAAV